MNPESGSFARCGRHPSQNFTGFCSSCLVERLSGVDSVERSPKPSGDLQKQVERRSCDVPVRKTLLSLFHMDDDEFGGGNAIGMEHQMDGSVNDVRLDEKGNGSENALGIKFESSTGNSQNKNVSKNVLAGVGFNLETRVLEQQNDFENHWVRNRVSSSVSAVDDVDVNVNAGSVKNPSFSDHENLKEKGVSFWLGSVFSRKVLKWRTKSYCKKNPIQAKSQSCGYVEKQLETKFDFDFRRHSCDRRVSCDSNKAFWDDPRHSWDGFLMGKSLETDGQNPSIYHRRRRSLPEEAMLVDYKPSTVTGETSTTSLVEEKTVSTERNLGQPVGDVHYEETRKDIAVSNFRRKFHRWSKVWNRSITSPFREFIQKRENGLERSLSESWRELHGERNMETMDTDRVHISGNNSSYERKHHISNKSKIPSNGDLQSLRFDREKKKGSMLGRSRSVHYSSPQSLDNGLLRFYLTPLRSSRRGATNKSRMRSSRSFASGILGFY